MKRIILVIIGCLLILSTDKHFVSASILADFNFTNNDIAQGFDGWYYSPYGDNACNIYNGNNQSNLCSTSSAGGLNRALKYYYNGYNNDHMGWMRWGYIDSEDNLSIEGNSLKIVFTGGAYNNEGAVSYSGLEVRSKEQFDNYISNGQNPYADRILPGGLSLYFTIDGNNNSFEELVGNDRLSLWILPPENSKYNFDNQFYTASYSRPEVLFSWYPFVVDANGDHYYHRLSNVNMGGWIHLIFGAHPQHNNSGDSNPYSYYRAGGGDFPGNAVSYFNNVNRFSLTSKIISDSVSPAYLYIDKIEAYKISQPENDETIANIGVGYDPINKKFDISFDDKYRCSECSAKYEVRYSFSPITNANYGSAKLAHITNFVRGASAVLGEVVKPANGYNEIWAGVDIDESDKNNLTNGTVIYFAVKDKSDRVHLVNRDSYDLETVEVEGVGNVRRVDLIKTIDYTIHQVNRPLEIVTDSLDDGHLGVSYEKQLEVKGGIYPYTWQTNSTLPRGLTLGNDGRIYGVPDELGDFAITVTVVDSFNPSQTNSITLELHIYNQENCTDGLDNDNDSAIDCRDSDCQTDTSCTDILVNFGDQANENIFSTSWNSVFMDVYTGYTNLGPDGTITTAGNNPSYNFQGVQGPTGDIINFKRGDKILVYWYNNLSSTIGFTPKLSFNDNNRIVNTPGQGDWYNMNYTEIEGGGVGVSEYIITNNTSGNQALININNNSNNTNNLVCDKIIWLHSGVENQTIRADVDQNSSINTTDAMLTLRNSLGLNMSNTNWFSSPTTGDVNCDNTSNSVDAMLILRHSLGLDMTGTGWCE